MHHGRHIATLLAVVTDWIEAQSTCHVVSTCSCWQPKEGFRLVINIKYSAALGLISSYQIRWLQKTQCAMIRAPLHHHAGKVNGKLLIAVHNYSVKILLPPSSALCYRQSRIIRAVVRSDRRPKKVQSGLATCRVASLLSPTRRNC